MALSAAGTAGHALPAPLPTCLQRAAARCGRVGARVQTSGGKRAQGNALQLFCRSVGLRKKVEFGVRGTRWGSPLSAPAAVVAMGAIFVVLPRNGCGTKKKECCRKKKIKKKLAQTGRT